MSYTNGLDKPSDYFNTVLYTGNGTDNHAITGVNFQPDFIWIKPRNEVRGHHLQDIIRGVNGALITNEASAEYTGLTNVIKSFDSDGFTLGTSNDVNKSANTHVSWNWLASNTTASNTDGSITSTVSANTTSGFSIVSWTGNGSHPSTIGHGLGSVPKMIITKKRSAALNWHSYHVAIGNGAEIYLNKTNAKSNNSTWNYTTPTSSVFTVGNNDVNISGATFIAYCFAEKKGFSKAFSYTGNGNSDGSFCYLGFRPAFILVKNTSTAGTNWQIVDNKRVGYNGANHRIYPDDSAAESTTQTMDILSNGFKMITTNNLVNASGSNYIGIAFAENPFVTSTGIPTVAR
jgi:hypothetical protein